MLIGVRLGGYTDFWIAGVELGYIYKFHTMGPASSLLPLSLHLVLLPDLMPNWLAILIHVPNYAQTMTDCLYGL